jgi:hypothetical protein
MPITFTPNLTPDFFPGSFNSAPEHAKLIYGLLLTDLAYQNPLQPAVDTLVAKIDSRTTELTDAKTAIQADIATLEGYLVVPTDPNTGLPLIDPLTGLPFSNIPECWDNAGYGGGDISTIISALSGIISNIDNAINTILPELKAEINVVGIDNFKLHMDLLSGVVFQPPIGIIKPNLDALMALAMGLTDIENRFGVTFVNHLVPLFGTLFTGDTTIANAQTDLDADFFVGTYAGLNVIGRVSACPPNLESNAPTVIAADIATFAANNAAWNTAVEANKPLFEQHIADDMAYYDTATDMLQAYLRSHGVASHIQDPFYAFMYTDVFGTAEVNAIITQYLNGEIE